MRNPRRDQAGFTILELLMGVAILAVTLSIAVPSFSAMMRTNRLAGQVNEMVTAMNYARSEAYKRGVTVSVCATNTSGACASSGTAWANGWLVITDPNNNGVTDTGETVLQTFAAPVGNFTYSPTPSSSRFVGFRPLGVVSGATTSIDIYKSGCSGIEKRTISVATTGRISLAKVSC
ncbi:MAG TPA: GspH/FimT family pseudopilin [Povalibacter sp.]|nr:GspH/FimT family pseudopilin [Povalibacter sp.]